MSLYLHNHAQPGAYHPLGQAPSNHPRPSSLAAFEKLNHPATRRGRGHCAERVAVGLKRVKVTGWVGTCPCMACGFSYDSDVRHRGGVPPGWAGLAWGAVWGTAAGRDGSPAAWDVQMRGVCTWTEVHSTQWHQRHSSIVDRPRPRDGGFTRPCWQRGSWPSATDHGIWWSTTP